MLVCRYSSSGNLNGQPPYSVDVIPDPIQYESDVTIDNVKFNDSYYTLKMKDLVLYSFTETNKDSSKPINYVNVWNNIYNLYIPSVSVNGINYHAILEYNNGTLTVKQIGENN